MSIKFLSVQRCTSGVCKIVKLAVKRKKKQITQQELHTPGGSDALVASPAGAIEPTHAEFNGSQHQALERAGGAYQFGNVNPNCVYGY